MRVLTVLGTRPEAIKLAPVIRQLNRDSSIDSRVCVTGQHCELLEPFLKLFRIEPSVHLALMRDNQTLPELSARVLTAFSNVLSNEQPDVVLVHGDTTTALMAAQAAYYSQIPMGHVEAGLRTGDKYDPFPEEMNRVWIDVVADLLFAPTAHAGENLVREGVDESRIYITGNTVVDALQWMVREQSAPERQRQLTERFATDHEISWEDRRVLLVTGHRRESFGEPFRQICHALRQIAERNSGVLVVYPVHLNPNVLGPVHRILENVPNVRLLEPLGYEEFVLLMQHAYLILTDSGGIQEEAPSLKTPVLVMRNTTERPEAIEAGVARLVGTETESIVEATQRLLSDPSEYELMLSAGNPFGDGHAAERIVDILKERLENQR
ncbi:non-hydrolyzing UDP-N-acetylglucosamine 2-epimerase [Candidatus Bipolaricaulota bacterium]